MQSPAPGAAVHLPSLASQAVVLPEPRERVSPPHSVPADVEQAPVTTDDKPSIVAKAAITERPREKTAAPAPAPVVIASPPRPVPAPAAASMPAAPLDLDALRARLRETAAIGLMAKIELRSQVDALVDRFRAHHAGGQPSAIDALRQSFNALVQKVLTLIREGDPALAAMLASSREAIWGVLEDPVKFNAVK